MSGVLHKGESPDDDGDESDGDASHAEAASATGGGGTTGRSSTVTAGARRGRRAVGLERDGGRDLTVREGRSTDLA